MLNWKKCKESLLYDWVHEWWEGMTWKNRFCVTFYNLIYWRLHPCPFWPNWCGSLLSRGDGTKAPFLLQSLYLSATVADDWSHVSPPSSLVVGGSKCELEYCVASCITALQHSHHYFGQLGPLDLWKNKSWRVGLWRGVMVVKSLWLRGACLKHLQFGNRKWFRITKGDRNRMEG